MLYLRYRRERLHKEYQARNKLARFIGYGASIHRKGKSTEHDLLVPVNQHKVERQCAFFEQKFPGDFELVDVTDFSYGVVLSPDFEPVSLSTIRDAVAEASTDARE